MLGFHDRMGIRTRSGAVAILTLFVLLLGGAGEECPDPDSVSPPSGCDPDSVAESNLDVCLPQKATFWGVTIRAAPDVPGWAFQYASNVLLKYLDSDEDGVADDSRLVAAIGKNNRRNSLGFAILKCRGSIGRGRLKDSWFGIARTQGQESLTSDVIFQRQVIEELHHGIYHGLEDAYPSVFEGSSSELQAAIDQTYGNCEESAVCAIAGNCQHYTCRCTKEAPETCTDAGEYDCSFNAGSCDGVFHYATPSCGGGCLLTEGFYHAWTTAYGYQCGGRAAEMASEWEICTAAGLASNPKTVLIHELVTGQAASQRTLGYVLPSALPDGTYNGTVFDDGASGMRRWSLALAVSASLMLSLRPA